MGNYQFAVIRGDGIGPEIVEEGIAVLKKIGEKFGHTFSLRNVWLAAPPLMLRAIVCRRTRWLRPRRLTLLS